MGETAISQSCRDTALTQHMHAHNIVNLACGDAGHHMRHQTIKHFSSQTARLAHAFKSSGIVKFYGAIAHGRRAVCG